MIAAARAALENLLATDAQFVADLAAAGLPPLKILRGNRRFEQIGQESYPCVVTDAGDVLPESAANEGGDANGLVINLDRQDWGADLELSFVWLQQDFAAAVNQRDALWPALVRLLLRNPDLVDTCTLAWVAGVENDQGYRHPTHVLNARVHVLAVIHRE